MNNDSKYENLMNTEHGKLVDMYIGLSEKEARMEARADALQKQIDNIMDQLAAMNQRNYGRKTETADSMQLQLDLAFNEAEVLQDENVPDPKLDEASPKRKKHSGKKKADLVKVTRRRTVSVELSDEELEKKFGKKGWKRLPNEYVFKLEHIPACFEAVTYEIAVYAGKDNSTIIRAPKPFEDAFPGSIATDSLVSSIIVAKYANCVPLYRQERLYEEAEVSINRATMANWILKTSKYFVPFCNELRKEMILQKIVHADETPFTLSKDGRTAGSKSYMWVYRTGLMNDGPVIVLYDDQLTRKADHPREFLEGFKGTVVCDGYQAYHKLENEHPEEFKVAGCWVHLKRKFAIYIKSVPEKMTGDTLAEEAVRRISKIYEEEHKLQNLSEEEHLRGRQEKIKPLVDEFFAWVKEKQLLVDSQSMTGKAFTYAIKQEKYLRTFLDDAKVPLDNNAAERAIRPFTIYPRKKIIRAELNIA